MICPYCQNEMEAGVIQTPYHETVWKKKRRILWGNLGYRQGSIVLSEHLLMEGGTVIAHCCHACGKIVIDYKDGACDMNRGK